MSATQPMTCAGDPATSTPSPTGLSTSEPAATRACRPIVMLPARRRRAQVLTTVRNRSAHRCGCGGGADWGGAGSGAPRACCTIAMLPARRHRAQGFTTVSDHVTTAAAVAELTGAGQVRGHGRAGRTQDRGVRGDLRKRADLGVAVATLLTRAAQRDVLHQRHVVADARRLADDDACAAAAASRGRQEQAAGPALVASVAACNHCSSMARHPRMEWWRCARAHTLCFSQCEANSSPQYSDGSLHLKRLGLRMSVK